MPAVDLANQKTTTTDFKGTVKGSYYLSNDFNKYNRFKKRMYSKRFCTKFCVDKPKISKDICNKKKSTILIYTTEISRAISL